MPSLLKSQTGASMILWTLSILPLLGFGALALDVSNLFVASAELQNAADAGALEGARNLYNSTGTLIQPVLAGTSANDAATDNSSRKSAVEVASVEVGHWHFNAAGGGVFTADTSGKTTPVSLVGKVFYDPTDEKSCNNLNNFCSGEINAVRVVTERRKTRVESFFGKIYPQFMAGYNASAEAVAYLGYAGGVEPDVVDIPIAFCKEELVYPGDGTLKCPVATMYSTGGGTTREETAGWTSFLQDESDYATCPGVAKQTDLRKSVCSNLNTRELLFGYSMSTKGGTDTSFFKDVYDCWVATTARKKPWTLQVPVIECGTKNPGPCNTVVGVLEAHILYIVDQNDKIKDLDKSLKEMTLLGDANGNGIVDDGDGKWEAPTRNTGESDEDYGVRIWNSFVSKFGIIGLDVKNSDGVYDVKDGVKDLAYWHSTNKYSGWQGKSIYFAPGCKYKEPGGLTVGRSYGIRATVPVLVD